MKRTSAALRSILLLPGVLLLGYSLSRAQDGSFVTSGCGCPETTTDTGPVLYGTLPGGTWHLGGTSLTFTHDGSAWSLGVGGSYLAPSQAATLFPQADDALFGALALPFAFTYPGGAGVTSLIEINNNGRIYLESGTNPYDQGWNASQIRPNFLGATPSICALGVDLNTFGGGAVSYETRSVGGAQVALITWERVPEYPDVGENTFQCQLWSSGEVVLSYQELSGSASSQEALVGISAGGGLPDPGASSLFVPLALGISREPVLGSPFTVSVRGLPTTSTSGFLSLGSTALGTPMPIAGAPAGCERLVGGVFSNLPLALLPPSAEVIIDWPLDRALLGQTVECQAFVTDPGLGTSVPVMVSNRGSLTLGAPPKLAFVVEGDNSYLGSADLGGFFRLESSPAATHAEITGLELSFLGTPFYFDVEGNAGVGAQGFFQDGTGRGRTCRNAFYGSDETTGLVYGPGAQASGCEGEGAVGWTGSFPVGGSSSRFQRLAFTFDDFGPGETFGFDCDTDGDAFQAGAHPVHVTVTFADSTSLTTQVQYVRDDRAEGVLIP